MEQETSRPPRKRRKEARPSEIIEAATRVFAGQGYAGTRLDEVARHAGVAKGTLYRYFETKEDLFRAVARDAFAANLGGMEAAATGSAMPLRELVPMLLRAVAQTATGSDVPAIARMVISESRKFPDLARIWHDNVVARVLDLLADVLTERQKRGEVRHGDARLQALSIVGPMIMAILFREVFADDSALRPDLDALAASHAETVVCGLLEPAGGRDGGACR
ncbi:TetR/AcrR family transcriptional regulator [Burkholderia plantarii]|uniref:TetR/AcrR family transcriptional regulator n=1 Tax=Burkholderia plantarii TaxID=41899 RepID=UPI0008708053|nr:TetR/AcrR family transcriptional regulator [Burkholderia plantarii]